MGLGRSALAHALTRAAIAAADPRDCTRRAIQRVRSEFDRPCTLFAFGKAARGMAQAALDEVVVASGIVIAPDNTRLGNLRVFRGEHPMPSTSAIECGEAVLSLARSLGSEDLALVLISGGGSAMLELPISGVDITDIAETSRMLMHAGADIAELNAVRRCLSQLKGGGLARALDPARVVAIVISDVPGRDPSLVASGPCSTPDRWPDPRTVIAERGIWVALPASVRRAIDACAREAAEGPDIPLAVAADVSTAAEGVRAEAARWGLNLACSDEFVRGEARIEGPRFIHYARARCVELGVRGLIVGGETTVTVQGNGRGGRRSEAAIAAGRVLGDDEMFLAIATDGIDGSSDAAAVWVDKEIIQRANAAALNADAMIADSDTYMYFAATGARVVTGRTGTNVADVWVWTTDC